MAIHSSILAREIPWSSLAGYSPWGQKRVRPNLVTKQQQYDIKTGALAQCKCIAGPHLPRAGSWKRHCKQGTEQNHTIPIAFPQPPLGVTSAAAFPSAAPRGQSSAPPTTPNPWQALPTSVILLQRGKYTFYLPIHIFIQANKSH